MRKSVKLAAASAFAAVALVGGSAGAAMADGHGGYRYGHGHGHDHDHDNNGFNICGNGSKSLASADDGSDAKIDGDVDAENVTDQTVCQTGDHNEANVHNEVEDGGHGKSLVQEVLDIL